MSIAMKVPATLATGNAVIVKPSELTPFSSGLFATLASETGLPDGVLTSYSGGPAAGEALLDHPGVAKISFTAECGPAPPACNVARRR